MSKPRAELRDGPHPNPDAIFTKQNYFRACPNASVNVKFSKNEKHLTASFYGVIKTAVSIRLDFDAKL